MPAYNRKDHFWKKAKQEGYRSRAAYKLLDIQKKHRIVRKGDRVLDLGCAPGGWLQVIAGEVGPSGRVFGVDRLPVKPLSQSWITVLRGDISEPEQQERLQQKIQGLVDLVTSDMSPDLSGVAFQDHCRSCELVRTAFAFSQTVLSPGGTFLAKVFQGEDLDSLVKMMSAAFRSVKRVIPPASRKASAEIYLLGKGFLGSRS